MLELLCVNVSCEVLRVIRLSDADSTSHYQNIE
jgi:hypothetical protein